MARQRPGCFGCLQMLLALVAAFCSLPSTDGSQQNKDRPPGNSFKCLQVPHYQGDSSDDTGLFMVVAICPAYSAGYWKDRCESEPENLLDIIPVTDKLAEVTYKNIFCAYCYGRVEVTRWQLMLNCPQVIKQGVTELGFVLPTISACSNLEIHQPSEGAPLPGLEYCAQADLLLNPEKRSVSVPSAAIGSSDPRLGYAALFNFGFDGQANLLFTDDTTSGQVCADPDQLYNPFELKCMRIRCPNDYMSVNGECMPRSLALGRIVQSQAANGNETAGSDSGGNSLRRSICMDVRLPAAAAQHLASYTARFEDDFQRHMVQSVRSTVADRVNVTLLTPVLSGHGHCKASSTRPVDAVETAELSANRTGNAPTQQLHLLATDSGTETVAVATSSPARGPTGATLADSFQSATVAVEPGGSKERPQHSRSAAELSWDTTARFSARNAQRKSSSARTGLPQQQQQQQQLAADVGHEWNMGRGQAHRQRRSSTQGMSVDPLLRMCQDQVCNSTNVQPGHASCGTRDCMVSMKVSFHLYHRKHIFDFLKKSWKNPFGDLLNSSNSSNPVCIEGVVHDDESSWCAGMTAEYFNQEFELLWSNKTEIVGVRVPGIGKSYSIGKFQVIVDLDKTYWANKNISQMAVVCDPMPKIVDANCSRISLGAGDYELMPNQSINATYLSHDPVFRKLPSYKELYTTDEYEYVYEEHSANANHNSTGNDENDHIDGSYVLQTCLPLNLILEYVSMLYSEQPSQNRPCAFLDDFAKASAIVGLVCTLVSLLAMTVTFLTYAMFRSLRTLAGASIMNLTAAEFAAQLTFLLGNYAGAVRDLCTTLAVLSHYFLLCSFFWTNVMAYIGYKSFGSGFRVRLVQRPSDARPLLVYAAYAYGVPAIVCTVCISINFGISQDSIGYGGITSVSSVPVAVNGTVESVSVAAYRGIGCWIANPMATLLSFGAPLVYCLLVNVCLFARTVCGMRAYQKGSSCRRSSSGVSESKAAPPASPSRGSKGSIALRRDSGLNGRRRDPSQLSIHVRLSVLYGFSWVFGVIIAVVGTNSNVKAELGQAACYVIYILNLFFNLLNGSMGTFIFFAFTFNERILDLYKSKFTRRAQSPALCLSQKPRFSSSQQTISSLLTSSSNLEKTAK